MAARPAKSDKKSAAKKDRPGAGRPTREEAERRHIELLDEALELFLEGGFDLTTIDAIAASVGMTKRTVYARYKDKTALFKASVERAIDRWLVPMETLKSVVSDDLRATLMAIAHILVGNALGPAGQRLLRVVNVESYRFPEIATLAYERGTKQTIAFLADVLDPHIKMGAITLASPDVAALTFLNMVVGAPARALVWGRRADKAAIEERTRFCVDLFLDGARRR
jgi:AcrR family transcriptional regulator